MASLVQEQTDAHLISAALTGDDGAFAQLVTRYKRRVFSVAVRFARDHDELDDICQEVFIKVYDNLRKFRHEAPFEHWITKITVRTCHDALRRRRHDSQRVSDKQAVEIRDYAVEARNDARDAREVLTWAMAQLKADERVIITLMELEEKTVKETAVLTGWSEENVKVRAHRARQALKRILEVDHGR
jgi:RNA polymerase sigma-70 factor, ECF subfamily